MTEQPKKVRGAGKKPRMVMLTVRVPEETYDYLYNNYKNVSVEVREVLSNYVKQQGAIHATNQA